MNKKLMLLLSMILISNLSLFAYAGDNLAEINILSFENNSVKFFNNEAKEIKPEEKAPEIKDKKEIYYSPAFLVVIGVVTVALYTALFISTKPKRVVPL